MTTLETTSLKIPYEIGRFIASQVPSLDSNHGGHPWAEHKDHFKVGPNPFRNQMKQD